MKPSTHILRGMLIVTGMLLFVVQPGLAQDYLKDIPTPSEIEAAFPIGGEGEERIESAARQEAVFSYFSTMIYREANRRSTPMRFTPEEQELYTSLTDDAKARIRSALGFASPPPLADPAYRAYEARVTAYSWGDKKLSDPLNRQIEAAFFPEEETKRSARSMATGYSTILLWVAAPFLGLLVTRPWDVVYRGEIGDVGSGVVMTGEGLFRLVEVRRNHLEIGRRRIGEFVLTQRMDDALERATATSGEVTLGIGRVLNLRWLLSVSVDGKSERANLAGALLRQLVLIPFFAIIAAVAALVVGSLFFNLIGGLAAALFVLGMGLGQILANIRAWTAG